MNLTRSLHGFSAGTGLGQLNVRLLEQSDAKALAAAYERNRGYLAPWEPRRVDEFFTTDGQEAVVEGKLRLYQAGSEVPWVVVDSNRIIGVMTLSGIVRGPFLSANLGYWIDEAFTGRGVATAVVGEVLDMARNELGLHRVQAATLVHNTASQAVLKRCGFERIGMAPSYLQIAGQWQDHVLFQRILF